LPPNTKPKKTLKINERGKFYGRQKKEKWFSYVYFVSSNDMVHENEEKQVQMFDYI